MSEIASFTPQQGAIIWDASRRSRSAGWQQAGRPPAETHDDKIILLNTEEEDTIPAYGCCEVVATITIGNVTALSVRKPTTTDGEYVFNSAYEIPPDGNGFTYRYHIVRMLGVAPSSPRLFRPVVGQWTVEEGDGPFVVFGGDTLVVGNGLIGRFAGGGGDPGPRLFGFTLTSDVASKSASATIHEIDGVDFGPSIGSHTLYDPAGWYAGGKTGMTGICYLQGGKYYALQSACPPPEEEE